MAHLIIISGSTPSYVLAAHALFGTVGTGHSGTVSTGAVVDGNDFLLVGISCSNSGSQTVTLGGLSGTLIGQPFGNNFLNVFQFSPSQTTAIGTSNTLSVTTGTSTGVGYSIFRVSSANPTPVFSGSNAGASSASVTATGLGANELLFGFAMVGAASSRTFTWSGLNEVYDEGGVGQAIWQTGATVLTTSGANVTATVTPSTATSTGLYVAAFRGL